MTNVQVDKWNSKVQKLNPNSSVTLLSKDQFSDTDDPHGILAKMITENVLNQFVGDGSSIPPHSLLLKKNDICILLRSVNKREKFTTNTRVRIVEIRRHTIRIALADENQPGNFMELSRFLFEATLPYGKSYKMTRRQFPLRLAYAMSINKAQGQTLYKAAIDLTSPCFTHGQLYVAMSRIQDASNTMILVDTEHADIENNVILTTNVVYDEMLQSFDN